MTGVCEYVTQQVGTVRTDCVNGILYIDYGRVELTAKDAPITFIEEIFEDLNVTTPEGKENLETVSRSLGRLLKKNHHHLSPSESVFVSSMGPTDEMPDTVTRVHIASWLELNWRKVAVAVGFAGAIGLVWLGIKK